jgi:tetratricopeptide (TPR) repeat protein
MKTITRRTALAVPVTLAVLLALAAPARADLTEDCVQSRDLDLGISGCTSVIQSGQYFGKDLSWAYNNRGTNNMLLGNYDRAIEDYDQALRLDPGYALSYYNRGDAYRRLGEYRQAIEDYDQALRLDPGYAEAYHNRGNVYGVLGEHNRAIKNYDQALLVNPGRADIYYNRGNSYLRLGNYRRAIEDYDQTLRINPGYASTYYNRAIAHCLFGMIEASLDDRMQTLRLGVLTAKDAQRDLRDRGFYKGAIDGDFGPASQKALREWTAAGCP